MAKLRQYYGYNLKKEGGYMITAYNKKEALHDAQQIYGRKGTRIATREGKDERI